MGEAGSNRIDKHGRPSSGAVLLDLSLLAAVVLLAVAGAVAHAATTASFTWSPQAPYVGQVVHFDGSASTCQRKPCTYTWTDEQPTGGLLGTGPVIDYAFQTAGTKYVTLTVTDRSRAVARAVMQRPSRPAFRSTGFGWWWAYMRPTS